MKKIAILSGAGVSQESGIRTFRDQDGLWEEYPVEDVASIDGWYRDRALVLRFYNERRAQLKTCRPNRAHELIASLEKNFEVTVITQNIDNLHEQAGSTKVIHLHGELCKARGENDPFDGLNEPSIYDIGYKNISLGDKTPDGQQLRPHIVWFGEAVPMIEEAAKIISESDMLIVIGTSLNVYPAAGLVHYIKNGAPLYLIDPQPIRVNYENYTQVQEIASIGMEKLLSSFLYKIRD